MSTIHQSFFEHLPDLSTRTREDGGSWEIRVSSESTMQVNAPKALEEVDPIVYFRAAFPVLNGPMLGSQLPAVEPGFHLRNEGDVVRASSLYLLHSVNLAIQAIVGDRGPIYCQSEFTHVNRPRTDSSHTSSSHAGSSHAGSSHPRSSHPRSSHPRSAHHRSAYATSSHATSSRSSSSSPSSDDTSGANTSRTDISWRWHNGRNWVVLGILELKNTQLLDKNDFDQGLADPNSTEGFDPDSLIVSAWDHVDHTHLGPSVGRVSQQARKYRERTNANLIAVFDWCSMLIFDFSSMNEDRGVLAKGTWFAEEAGQESWQSFRMLLLGMLVEGWIRNQ